MARRRWRRDWGTDWPGSPKPWPRKGGSEGRPGGVGGGIGERTGRGSRNPGHGMCAASVATEFGGNCPGQESVLCLGRDSLRQRSGARRTDLFRRADENSRRAGRHHRIHRATKAEMGGEMSAATDYEIAPEELRAQQEAGGDVVLLDVREPWECEIAKIANSKSIPMGDIPARFNQELDPEKHIVVICHHGVRSMNVTAWLRQQGFEKAQSLRGGIDRWARQIDPTVPVY